MKFRLISRAALGLCVAFVPALAISAAFTAGDVVIYRVGTGTGSLVNTGNPVFLDEYSPTGTLVQSVALPTTTSGANVPLVCSGTATSEGLISLSADGHYLIATGYDTTLPGSGSLSGLAIPRTIGRIDANATIDTSTALTDFASGNNPRSATSDNGTNLWMDGGAGGIRYTTLGTTTSTQLSTTVTNLRQAAVFGGQLYVSDSSGSAVRIGAVGTGLPQTAGQTITNLPGIPTSGSPYAFVLLDLSGSVAGLDTLYVADDTNTTGVGGIIKYSLVGSTWVSNGIAGNFGDAYRGLTASVSGSTVTLYATRKGGSGATGGGELVKLVDSSGYNGAFSGTPTLLAAAAANTAFRGVAFAPAAPVVIPALTVTAPATIIEGNTGTSIATFTVTLDNPAPAGGVTFQIDTVDGTATAGSDYVAIVAGSGSIAAGQTSTTFGVTIDGDTVYEGNETFAVNLSNITNTTNASASANATITEDDPQPTITVGDASVVEGNSGSTVMSFPVTLSNASIFDVSFTAQTQNGTATAGSDYDALTTTVTITAGMTTGTIFVGVHGDTTVEPDETFTLALTNPVNGTLGNTTATGTILNDDNVTPTFSINNVTHAEGNAGTTNFVFTVSSNVNAPAAGYTLNVDTADGTATEADGDYVGVHTTVTIPSGATSAPVTVVVNGDNKFEADETFSVTLSNQPAGTILGTATGTGTISNDDSVPTLSVANVSVNEGNSGTTNATFTVSLTNPTSSDVTFTINTADGTATAGSDYVAIVNGSGTITAGNTSTTVTVTVNGDTTVEANETFALNLSAITNTANATASATGTILNDDITTIMQIQGHGTASPLAGLSVTTHGVVTALKTNGFFLQDPVGDNDLTTSDAVFVFTSSAPAVQIGDGVSVTGTVQEFGGSTEISGTPTVPLTVTVTAHPAALQPQAYVLDTSAPTNDPTTGICMGAGSTIANPPTATDGYQASNFACLDGMLVTLQNGIVTGSTFASGQDGVHTGTPTETWVKLNDGSPHPFHGVGAQYPGLGAGIPVWSGEPEVIELYYPGLANFHGPALNDGTTFTVTGVMQGFTASGATSPIFEIYPATLTTNTVVSAAQELQPVADSAAGTLTIGSQNLLHFFNATADGADTSGYNDTCTGTGASDQCPTSAEYDARLSKWAKQICNQLKMPVVMDLEEIENISVARDLAARAGTTCGVTYVPYVIPGNDVSGINIGILVRGDVVVSSVTQMYKNTMTANCSSGTSCLLNDRPPVLMQATWNGYRFALLAIYDRSLSGLGDPTKPYIGPKRAEQAAQIAQIAQAWQSGATLTGAGDAQQNATGTITPGPFNITGDSTVPLIVAGDFNAYEFTDGYADVTGMIKGTAVQSQNLYWYNGNASDTDTPPYVKPNPTLVDTGDKAGPGQRYSYNFSGMRQEIDHILLSRRAWQDFVSIGNAHGDADVSGGDPVILDGSTPARSGDHDGQVVTIAIDRIFADGYEAQP